MAYFIPRDPNERHIHLNLVVRQFDTMLYPTLVFFFFWRQQPWPTLYRHMPYGTCFSYVQEEQHIVKNPPLTFLQVLTLVLYKFTFREIGCVEVVSSYL